jgi:hypothetical protein
MNSDNPIWEIHRYDWASLEASVDVTQVPAALQRLMEAETEAQARGAYWQIDNTVVFQTALYPGALPTIKCLTTMLPVCTPVARRFILELMEQIGGWKGSGTDESPTPTDEPRGHEYEQDRLLRQQCQRELLYSVGAFLSYLEHGTPKEQNLCIYLLATCALRDRSLKEQVVWHLKRYMATRERDYGLVELVEGLQQAE